MKKILLICSIFLLAVYVTAYAFTDPDKIIGTWTSIDGVRTIEIYGEGELYFGKILENKHQEKDQIPVGTIIMKDFAFQQNRWEGRLSIPSKSANYKAFLTIDADGSMKSTVKLGPFSKSKTWKKVK